MSCTRQVLKLVVTRLVIIVVRHTAGTAAIKLTGDGVCDVAELLLLLVEVLGLGRCGVLLEPVLSFLNGFKKLYSWSVYRSG